MSNPPSKSSCSDSSATSEKGNRGLAQAQPERLHFNLHRKKRGWLGRTCDRLIALYVLNAKLIGANLENAGLDHLRSKREDDHTSRLELNLELA
jgi:hypothetical protein